MQEKRTSHKGARVPGEEDVVKLGTNHRRHGESRVPDVNCRSTSELGRTLLEPAQVLLSRLPLTKVER